MYTNEVLDVETTSEENQVSFGNVGTETRLNVSAETFQYSLVNDKETAVNVSEYSASTDATFMNAASTETATLDAASTDAAIDKNKVGTFSDECPNESVISDSCPSPAQPEMTSEQIRRKCLQMFEESVQQEPVSVVLKTLGDFMQNCQEVFSDCEDDEEEVILRIGRLLVEMGRWAEELEKKVGPKH